jgi:hypothetical protein
MSAEKTKEKAPKAPKEKKEKTPAPRYQNLPQAKAIMDEEKRLKVVPTDFDFDKHESLRKGDFVSEHLYMEWKAAALDYRAAEFTKRSAELRTEAAHQRQFGDPSTKSKFKRHAKLMEKLKELEKELQAAGVQIEG